MKLAFLTRSTILLISSLAFMACGSTGSDSPGTDTGSGTDSVSNMDQGGTDSGTPAAGTLAAINNMQAGLDCHTSGEPAFLNLVDQVSVDGIVVVSPKFDAFTSESDDSKSLDGYYVADADGGPNSGLLLTVARNLASDFQIGDTLNVQGEAMEYYCRTQLKALQITPVSTGAAVSPTDIASEDMVDAVKVELLEGSLVRITDAVVEEELDYGQYRLMGGAIIDDSPFLQYEMSLEVGTTLPELVGVVNYSYKSYTISPRTAEDVPGATVEPPPVASEKTIAEVQQESAGLSCHEAGDDPQFVNLSSGFSMTGLIVTMEKFDAYTNENDDSKSLDGYYVSDGTGNAYGGVMMVVPRGLGTNLALGAVVDVKADGTEFYCNTQIKAFELTEVSVGDPVSAIEIAQADLLDAAVAEGYEGMFVTFTEAVVADGPNDYGDYTLDSGVVIDDKYVGEALSLSTGSTYVLHGVVHYAFGRYALLPRTTDDVQDFGTPSE